MKGWRGLNGFSEYFTVQAEPGYLISVLMELQIKTKKKHDIIIRIYWTHIWKNKWQQYWTK